MSVGTISINTKEFSTVLLKALGQVIGGSVGGDVYDAIVKKETGSIDARIAKIEMARSNLLEALSAIDEIKSTAEQHRKELESIRDAVDEMGKERDQLSADKELLIQMTSAEQDRLRQILGVPTRLQSILTWFGTFIFGAVASWFFNYAYDFKIKELLQGWGAFIGI
ncbi:hypothetical protein [Rhizobium brockwellii]|uniref:hypothetical protein n=1 Tax=Rhizobium brockwellii TaxID=3019932 RepID=UPI00293DA789|nr:hypothetical protein [Rhizobium brockwellii]MDV4159222.1 hypothetical protein [Rhizobium brockwellii]